MSSPAAPAAATTAPQTLRRTPLHSCHVAAGARMVGFAGWDMPVQYAGVIEEHRAVRQAAGLFDVSHMGEIRVHGAGALAFLQRLTPNDVARLAVGRAHYSGLLTERGTYIDDLLVYRLAADDFLLVVNASNAQADLAWIQRQAAVAAPAGSAGSDNAAAADVQVSDQSDSYALLSLQGPRALQILASLAAGDVGGLRYYGFLQGQVGGAPALISRTGYTGEDGFELYVAPEHAPDLWQQLLAAGAPHGLQPAGLGARDTLRLEAAMALYGHELDSDTTPFEAGLAWVVKLDKGDFIGRQALVEQREAGAHRKLAGFTVLGRGIARQGHSVLSDGSAVGAVTSGTWSPTLDQAIGMAYVPAALATPGTPLGIDVRGRTVEAVASALPFYRRPVAGT
jgi:aminomethyltransferase